MIVASLLLVIAAAVTLLVGLLNREQIEWVYASIACCLLAGLLLTIGVLRSRPSRKPVLQSGGEGQGASWAGASQWGGAAGADTGGGTGTLSRDEDDAHEATGPVGTADEVPAGDDEPTRTSMPAADTGPSPWAPADEADDDAGVRIVEPPADPDPEATPEPEPQPEPVAAGDDVVVVPKPSARGDVTAEEAGAGQTVAEPSAATGLSATEEANTGTDDAARFEQVLAPIAGVGKAKRTALYNHFGTYRKLRAATPEKLAEVPGISRTLADRIYTVLHS